MPIGIGGIGLPTNIGHMMVSILSFLNRGTMYVEELYIGDI